MNHCVTSPSLGVFLRDLAAHSAAVLHHGQELLGWPHKKHHWHSASVLVAQGLLQQTYTHMPNSTLLRHNPINLNGITHGLKFLQDQH